METDLSYTVSVRLMTYNHVQFIKQAMDSIMKQQTDFLVEVVVGDDFSNDGTLDIIQQYSSTERIHLRILKREVGDDYWLKRQRLGRLYNFTDILKHCHGKYIALLDGDDYWIDPFKLQMQIDFLEGNRDYILLGAGALRVDLYGNILNEVDVRRDVDLSFIEASTKNPFVSAAICFRAIDSFKSLVNSDFLFMDRTLSVYLLQFGKSRNLPENLVAYRENPNGVHTGSTMLVNRVRTAENMERVLKQLSGAHKKVVRKSLVANYSAIIKMMIKTRRLGVRPFFVKLMWHILCLMAGKYFSKQLSADQ